MNIDILKGKWDQLKGKAQQKWRMLSKDDIDVINGNFGKLSEKIQDVYGIEKDEAEKQIKEWCDRNSKIQ